MSGPKGLGLWDFFQCHYQQQEKHPGYTCCKLYMTLKQTCASIKCISVKDDPPSTCVDLLALGDACITDCLAVFIPCASVSSLGGVR